MSDLNLTTRTSHDDLLSDLLKHLGTAPELSHAPLQSDPYHSDPAALAVLLPLYRGVDRDLTRVFEKQFQGASDDFTTKYDSWREKVSKGTSGVRVEWETLRRKAFQAHMGPIHDEWLSLVAPARVQHIASELWTKGQVQAAITIGDLMSALGSDDSLDASKASESLLTGDIRDQVLDSSRAARDEDPSVATRMLTVLQPDEGPDGSCPSPYMDILRHPRSLESCPGCGGIRRSGYCPPDSAISVSFCDVREEALKRAQDLTDPALPAILRKLHPNATLAKGLILTTLEAIERETAVQIWTELQKGENEKHQAKAKELSRLSIEALWKRLSAFKGGDEA